MVSYIGYEKLIIKGIDLINNYENEFYLKPKSHEFFQEITLRYIISCPPIINKDPESHGETIINGDELRRSPY